MTIDEIIRKIEMVRDDLWDGAEGARCQAHVLLETVEGLEDLKKTMENIVNRLEKEEWHFKGLPDKDEEVLAKFAVRPKDEKPAITYHLVCRFNWDKEEWQRVIDGDPVLDRHIAWKYIA